MMLYLWSDCED